MAGAVNQLLATEAALDKLGARGISVAEAEQTLWNLHVIVRNRRGLDPADVQVVQPSCEHHLIVQFTLDGDDAAALQKLARSQGERPG